MKVSCSLIHWIENKKYITNNTAILHVLQVSHYISNNFSLHSDVIWQLVTFVINGTSHTTLRHEIFKSMYYIFQYYEQRHKILKHCDDNHYAISTYFEDF